MNEPQRDPNYMNDYPRKFNSSDISHSEKKIISDFHDRRKIFDDYIQSKGLKFFTCPSCGYPTLGERGGYEICSICDWEDDNQDNNKADEIWDGPNSNLSLTESRLNIGKKLQQLATDLKGTINQSSEEVFQVIKNREQEIEDFRKKNITMTTDISDPVWKDYASVKKDTLRHLIKGL